MKFHQKLTYAGFVIFHPFKGFWDIKNERKGDLKVSLFYLALLYVSMLLHECLGGYLFRENENTVSVVRVLLSVLLPVFFWCVVNWSLTTLMDGEGSFRDIATMLGYAIIPMIGSNLLLTVLSNILTIKESMYLTLLSGIGIAWTALLIVCGTQVVHQYSLGKTVATIFLTLVGIVVLVFLLLLGYNLFQQVVDFVQSVVRELLYRL